MKRRLPLTLSKWVTSSSLNSSAEILSPSPSSSSPSNKNRKEAETYGLDLAPFRRSSRVKKPITLLMSAFTLLLFVYMYIDPLLFISLLVFYDNVTNIDDVTNIFFFLLFSSYLGCLWFG
jgi:hypothetical protein